MLLSALRFSHPLLEEVIQPGDLVVDATMGNGNDTLFLAQLVGKKGRVEAFDVQQQALDTTYQRLKKEASLEQVNLNLLSHDQVDTILKPTDSIKAAIFNLGYLPKGNKEIITKSKTTLQAIDKLLKQLAPKGRIIVVIYSGHPGGEIEKKEVLDYTKKLPQDVFSVLHYQFINQKNEPPMLICIERKN